MPRVDFGSAVYCSIGDIKKWIRKQDAFGQNGNPTDEQVLSMIRSATDRIDEYTRHSWRVNTVVKEKHQYDTVYRWDAGRPVMLNKMDVKDFDEAEGDLLEVWDGNKWDDWVSNSSYDQGRDQEYWIDNHQGQLWIYDRFVWRSRPQLRITYRYGEDRGTTSKTTASNTSYDVIDAPHDIKEACAKLVAVEILESDQYSNTIPGSDGGGDARDMAQGFREDVWGTSERTGVLDRHKIDPAWVDPY